MSVQYAIAVFCIFACWKWGDLSRWRSLLPTLLYIIVANLTYGFLAGDRPLWVFHNNIVGFKDRKIVELLYVFIITPTIAFLFLSHLPKRNKSLVWVLPVWTVGMTGIEYCLHWANGITYHYGWTIGWSMLFYAVMFPMLLLHYYRPLWAYPLSVLITAFYMTMFDVPLLGK